MLPRSASLTVSRARLTESPTPLDEDDEVVAEGKRNNVGDPFQAFGTPGAAKGSAFRVHPPVQKSGSEWSKLSLDDHGTDSRDTESSAYRLIAVSCKLFIRAKKQEVSDKVNNPNGWGWKIEEDPYELLPTALKHLHQDSSFSKVPYYHIGFIGGTYVEPEDRPVLTSILINKYRCVPIYLEKAEVEGFYHGFCKGVLWPLLHYSLRTKNFVNKFKHFGMYKKVNERFADAVLRIYRKGDVVWLHDYHLFLAARKIRERIPTAAIGFFMHSPFPTVELFRQLPVRKDLLEGMLAADVIGFNAYSYCNHHRAACEALLSIDTEGRGLLASDGRFVRTHITPAGVDFPALEKLVSSPLLQDRVLARRKEPSLSDLMIVVGRSRKLDEAQGTLLRLQAFEEFLKQNREWKGRVVLLEVVDQTASSTDAELQALVQETVGNINGRHGELGRPPPVHLVQPRDQDSFTMEESCELYMLANVLMVTPLRDGLSLSSHEAVVCQGDYVRPDGTMWKGNKAPLILSEFAGAATALGGSIIVNPHDVTQVSRELRRALMMNEEERAEAHHHNFQYVKRNTTAFWAAACLKEITAAGTTMNITSAELRTDTPLLGRIRDDYMQSTTRLMLLDWDGSMVPLLQNRGVQMSESVDELLEKLCADPHNTVYVMSGRRRSELETLFARLPKVGMMAEHGSFVRPPGETEWVHLAQNSKRWMEKIEELLSDYSDRTPGSVTETKDASLTWHWREADHDFAGWMEKDLVVQLHQRMTSLPFTCFLGRRSVEIHDQGVSKVAGVQWVLENRHKDFDFVMTFGDDKGDEELFEYINYRPEVEYNFQTTPPLGISPPTIPAASLPETSLGVSRTGSDMKKSASSENIWKGGKRKVGDKKVGLGVAQGAPALRLEAKRWTVRVGPNITKTHAAVSIERVKDAPEMLLQIVTSQPSARLRPPGMGTHRSPNVADEATKVTLAGKLAGGPSPPVLS